MARVAHDLLQVGVRSMQGAAPGGLGDTLLVLGDVSIHV